MKFLSNYINIVIFLLVLGVWGLLASPVNAGFGISPPYVKTNKPIFPGSSFEQRITLIRSSAQDDMQAEITVSAPGMEGWLSIDRGLVFDLPEDELKIPMIVRVEVPNNAEIGSYKGNINIRIVPKSEQTGGGVAIALGARVDVDLTVTNEEFLDFQVRTVSLGDFEMLGFPWKYKIFSMFFHRIKVAMLIENLGNAKVAPSRVHLDVYDITEKDLLGSYDDYKIKKVEPFRNSTTYAYFPTKLGPGRYWANIKVYKDDNVIYKNKLAFNILEEGAGTAKNQLGIWPWLMLAALFLFALILIMILIKIKIWIYIGIALYILSWPLRKIFQILKNIWKSGQRKFWSYMHQKSKQYRPPDEDNQE